MKLYFRQSVELTLAVDGRSCRSSAIIIRLDIGTKVSDESLRLVDVSGGLK